MEGKDMERTGKSDGKEDRSTWAIGGGVLAGLGAGLFLLPASALAFVGSLLIGLGVGLTITSILSRPRR
jgi:hypothetical protein